MEPFGEEKIHWPAGGVRVMEELARHQSETSFAQARPFVRHFSLLGACGRLDWVRENEEDGG